jgi:hypothetical protein
MASTTSIANYALALLGEDPIQDLETTNTTAARLARQFLPIARDELLRSFPWRGFIVRAELSPDSQAPEWGYTKRFLLPSTWQRVIDVYLDGCPLSERSKWVIEGQYILCNADGPLQIRYMKRDEDVNNWESLFQGCVAHRMAIHMAEPIQASPSKAADVQNKYKQIMKEARHANGQEMPPSELHEPNWLEKSRFGLSPYYGGRL